MATQTSDTTQNVPAPKRLTTTTGNDSSPVWSPDSQKIAFISKRAEDESSSLYVMSVNGGEAEKVLELPYGVGSPQWMPDGKSIVIASTSLPELTKDWSKENLDLMTKEQKRRKDSKLNVKVSEDRQYRYWDHWITDGMASHLLKST